jgi:hypothetical protein
MACTFLGWKAADVVKRSLCMIHIFNRNWFDTRWQQYTTHLHKNSTQNTEKGEFGKCGPCPVFASYTLAFALQLRKKNRKTSIMIAEVTKLMEYENSMEDPLITNCYNERAQHKYNNVTGSKKLQERITGRKKRNREIEDSRVEKT